MYFYAAAAPVIPVLLLAIIFENRLLLRRPSSYDPTQAKNASSWNVSQIVLRVYVTLLIAAAEVAALIGLYRQETSHLTNSLVWLGLGAALAALVGSVMVHQLRYWRKWWSTRGRTDWWFPGLTLVLLVVLTVGFLNAVP